MKFILRIYIKFTSRHIFIRLYYQNNNNLCRALAIGRLRERQMFRDEYAVRLCTENTSVVCECDSRGSFSYWPQIMSCSEGAVYCKIPHYSTSHHADVDFTFSFNNYFIKRAALVVTFNWFWTLYQGRRFGIFGGNIVPLAQLGVIFITYTIIFFVV